MLSLLFGLNTFKKMNRQIIEIELDVERNAFLTASQQLGMGENEVVMVILCRVDPQKEVYNAEEPHISCKCARRYSFTQMLKY